MKENILERILRAEHEFDQMLEKVHEQAEEYASAIQDKRDEGVQALHQHRLTVEREVNEKFRLAYAEKEKAMLSTIENKKQALRLSKESQGVAIASRLKSEILEGFFA